jgi:7-cyano-7-deazaguanine synthase in queuosine biosynthesis
MNWHLVLRIGNDDNYSANVPADAGSMLAALERSGAPYLVQQNVPKVISGTCGRPPSARALDLLTVAMAVFAADLRVPRVLTADRWQRDISLHVPVFDVPAWEDAAAQFVEMLGFLTGDSWDLRFRERPPFEVVKPKSANGAAAVAKALDVALFSGGLDSLAGAIDLLESGRPVALVGHYGAGVTNSVQQNVLSALQAHYGANVFPFMFHVQPLKAHENEGEQTMRSRSLLFLAMGVAVATTLGSDRRLVVTENGFISLNVPLTLPRMGSASTRTTHPHFVSLFRGVLAALELDTWVELPGLFLTKGELLSAVRNPTLLGEIAPLSMSCSHPELGRYHRKKPGNHCGYCVPCIVRRASMAAASVPDATYDTDVVNAGGALTTATGSDLRAFEIALARQRDASSMQRLTAVLNSGPLAPEDAVRHAAVYARGLDEIARFLGARRTV